ncbi:MAG: hypothetical protein INF91_06715 [Alphaproteobacteria bacterium]|nr:hypothetical protein [Alphaproteobacteria bacterium]
MTWRKSIVHLGWTTVIGTAVGTLLYFPTSIILESLVKQGAAPDPMQLLISPMGTLVLGPAVFAYAFPWVLGATLLLFKPICLAWQQTTVRNVALTMLMGGLAGVALMRLAIPILSLTPHGIPFEVHGAIWGLATAAAGRWQMQKVANRHG